MGIKVWGCFKEGERGVVEVVMGSGDMIEGRSDFRVIPEILSCDLSTQSE